MHVLVGAAVRFEVDNLIFACHSLKSTLLRHDNASTAEARKHRRIKYVCKTQHVHPRAQLKPIYELCLLPAAGRMSLLQGQRSKQQVVADWSTSSPACICAPLRHTCSSCLYPHKRQLLARAPHPRGMYTRLYQLCLGQAHQTQRAEKVVRYQV